MREFVRDLSAAQLLRCRGGLGIGLVDRRGRFRQIIFHLRNLKDRENLPFANAVAYVDLDRLYVSGDLRHHVDLLKGLEFRRQQKIACQVFASRLRDRNNRDRSSPCLSLLAARFGARARGQRQRGGAQDESLHRSAPIANDSAARRPRYSYFAAAAVISAET